LGPPDKRGLRHRGREPDHVEHSGVDSKRADKPILKHHERGVRPHPKRLTDRPIAVFHHHGSDPARCSRELVGGTAGANHDNEAALPALATSAQKLWLRVMARLAAGGEEPDQHAAICEPAAAYDLSILTGGLKDRDRLSGNEFGERIRLEVRQVLPDAAKAPNQRSGQSDIAQHQHRQDHDGGHENCGHSILLSSSRSRLAENASTKSSK
jgi:hypothetical protein